MTFDSLRLRFPGLDPLQALDLSPNAILGVDVDGHVVYANAAAARLFDWPPVELDGAPLDALLPAQYVPRHHALVDRFAERPMARPLGVGIDLAGRRRDGSEFPAEISLAPVSSTSGLVVFATVIDRTVRRSLERRLAQAEARAALDRLEETQAVLVAMANAIEARDPTTERHCRRLAEMAVGMTELLDLAPDLAEAIAYGAALHDVGKIGVPEAVLKKPGSLDEAEWGIMRQHPAIGAAIIEPLRLSRLSGPIVRGHHERWDGSGYPDHLVGRAIPVGARIVAVVDAFDAITHERAYRASRSRDEAVSELRAGSGHQFDPDLVAVFLANLDGLTEAKAPRHEEAREYTRGLRADESAA